MSVSASLFHTVICRCMTLRFNHAVRQMLPCQLRLTGSAPLFQCPALGQAVRGPDFSSRQAERYQFSRGTDPFNVLLRCCKVLCLLRCSPLAFHSSLEEIDAMLTYAVQHIANSKLSDCKWVQASLPVRDGLGIRRVSTLAIPAFMVSAASTVPFQTDLLEACTKSASDLLQSYLPFGDSELSRRVCSPNNHSGTVLACCKMSLWWRIAFSVHHRASFLATNSQ